MKATLRIKKIREDEYMVVIENGYGNEITLTDRISLEEAMEEVSAFLKKDIKIEC